MGQGTDGFKQGWKNLKTCEFPLFSLMGPVLKSPERASKPSSNYINMVVTSIVSIPVANIYKKSDFVAKVAKPFKKFDRGKSLINPKKLTAVVSMASIQGKLSRYHSVSEIGNIVSLRIGLEKVLWLVFWKID